MLLKFEQDIVAVEPKLGRPAAPRLRGERGRVAAGRARPGRRIEELHQGAAGLRGARLAGRGHRRPPRADGDRLRRTARLVQRRALHHPGQERRTRSTASTTASTPSSPATRSSAKRRARRQRECARPRAAGERRRPAAGADAARGRRGRPRTRRWRRRPRRARATDVRLDTQRNLLIRRILDEMGLRELEELIQRLREMGMPRDAALADRLAERREALFERGRAASSTARCSSTPAETGRQHAREPARPARS